MSNENILEQINSLRAELAYDRVGDISDGYHTFNELYKHRIELFITVCRLVRTLYVLEETYPFNGPYPKDTYPVWKSRTHSDGSVWNGWFLLGINYTPGTQMTYHLPDSYWDLCPFEELDKAPDFDGHTSEDVLERLKRL